MFDGNVVFESLAPGFEYVVSVQSGGGHEQQFDPFAALLESFETLPFFRLHTPRFVPIKKARPIGRAFVFLKFALYIQNIKMAGVNRQGFRTLYFKCFQRVRANRVISAY